MLVSSNHQHESTIDLHICPLSLDPPSYLSPVSLTLVLFFWMAVLCGSWDLSSLIRV